MNEAELNYIAGFFDADGSIGSYTHHRSPRLTIRQNVPRRQILYEIQSILGYGNVRISGKRGSWTVDNARQLTEFILTVGRKTRVKKEQLSLALAYVGMSKMGRRHTAKARAYRLKLNQRIQILKRSR